MRELRSGLWHWQAPHPEWTPEQWWPPLVSSYALDDGERLLLFDPLAVPETILHLATDREPAVVLTAPWHERDAERLVERLESGLHAAGGHRRRPRAEVRHRAGRGPRGLAQL